MVVSQNSQALMKNPKISVLIYFLNAPYLSEAIESVFWQTFKDWELVLVDGGSDDQVTYQNALDWQKRYPERVRVIRHSGQEKLGIYSSRVCGAKEARADILGLLDSDDQWQPHFLEKHLEIHWHYFKGRKGMVYCPQNYVWTDVAEAGRCHVQPMPAPGLYEPAKILYDFFKDFYWRSAGNSGTIISREIIVEAGELIGIADETMTEDQYLWGFVGITYPIFVSPEPLVRYRLWPGSTCARGVAEGRNAVLRKRHLEWFVGWLKERYSGKDRDWLIEKIQELIREESVPLGKWKLRMRSLARKMIPLLEKV